MRRVGRRLLQRRHHHLFDLVQQDRRRPARARLIDQAVQAVVDEPAPPLGDRVLHHPQVGRDLLVRRPGCGAGQDDPRPQRQRLRRLRPPRPPLQLVAFGAGQHQIRLRASRPSAVDQAIHTGGFKSLAPLVDRCHRHTQIGRHPRRHRRRLGQRQHNPGPNRTPRRPAPRERDQSVALLDRSARICQHLTPQKAYDHHTNLRQEFPARHTRGGRWAFFLRDVDGHGPAAAAVTSLAQRL